MPPVIIWVLPCAIAWFLLLQAIALAAAEAIAALVAVNIVGSLTAKKSGSKAHGK